MFTSLALLIVGMFSVQIGASFAKNLFPIAGAAGTTALRLFFASLILWLFWRPWREFKLSPNYKYLFLYGSVLGLMNLTFYFALERIPLGVAVTFEFIGPLAVSLLSSRKRADFFWVLLAGTGIYLVMPVSHLATPLDPIGVVFALMAGAFWGLYILFGKKAGENLTGGVAAAIGMSIAALVSIPFGLVLDGSRIFNSDLIFLGIGVALLSSAIPYSIEMYSLKKMPAKTFGILMSLEPAVASFVGIIFLGESLTLTQYLAIFCVSFASLGSSIGSASSQ